MYKHIIEDIKKGIKPTPGEIVRLLEADDVAWVSIFKEADIMRMKYAGNTVHIRGIIEFSNYCKRHCTYCGLNCRNKKIKRFRMTSEEIVDTAIEGFDVGYKTVVLQSGEDSYFTAEILGEIVKKIKKHTSLSVTLSCGEMSFLEYEYLKDCGADRYLIKHETADNDIYSALHPDASLENRIKCLKNLKKLGFETGGGFMIGLPGQTSEIIAKDILLLDDIPCDMAGIGPFIPHQDTALAGQSIGSAKLTKKAVAITRLIVKNIHLPATTALGVIDENDKKSVFSCGANVIMRKLTPANYRKLYDIYPADFGNMKTIKQEREILEDYIKSLGKVPK